MARDTTLEQKIESTLCALGLEDTGEIAGMVVDTINEHNEEQAGIEQVTPVEGSMSSSEHTAFMLRIFMYLVAVQPNKTLIVDLERVKALTGDHTLDVKLEGATFTAKATQHRLNDRGLLI